MKQTTASAARSLSSELHPANLMIFLAEMGCAFEDVWPSVDESWIDAIRGSHWKIFQQAKRTTDIEISAAEDFRHLGVSDDAGFIVDKLKRKSKWGDASVTLEALQKMTHLEHARLVDAIDELCRSGLLIRNERTGVYSLDPGRQYEINRISEILAERPRAAQ